MEERKNEVVMCVQCGERPAVVTKTTGKPTHHLCKECFARKIRRAWDKKLANKQTVDEFLKNDLEAKEMEEQAPYKVGQADEKQKRMEEAVERLKAKAEKKLRPLTITLDFTEYQALYATLAQGAKSDFRSVEMQALYIIKQSFTA